MSPAPPPLRPCPPGAGLCAECAHLRLVGSAGRSTFVMCGRARDDARFARYPRLPVQSCAGFESRPAAGGDGGDETR